MADYYQFLSITKFVERINNDFQNVQKAVLYFEGVDTFKNKYERTCCKPVFIELEQKHNNKVFIQHKEILEMFDGLQLVVSFSENNKRKIDENKKDSMFKLNIYFQHKEFNGNAYYSSVLREVNNAKNVEKIRNQITVYEEDNDLPDDAFFIDDGLTEAD